MRDICDHCRKNLLQRSNFKDHNRNGTLSVIAFVLDRRIAVINGEDKEQQIYQETKEVDGTSFLEVKEGN